MMVRAFPNKLVICRYLLMNDCWKADPRQRPTFTEIRQRLESILSGSPDIEVYVDQMTQNFYDILDNMPGEKC